EGTFHGLMVQLIGGVSKIRTAGAEYRAFHHWVSKYTEKLHLVRKIQLYQDLVKIFNLVLPTIALGFLFWRATKLTVGLEITNPDRISIGDFIAFNTAFTLYLTGWSDVSNTLVGVLDSIVKGHRIKPLLMGKPEVADDASDPGRLSGHVRFENVSFRYAEDGPLILDSVSFDVHQGEFVAFVGPSGSGKSTVLRLLLGFEVPEYGRVLYDGQDLAGLDVLAVRRQIGSVLQNGRLNAGSIVDNVANNSRLTHGEIWDAVADAGMSEDIKSMPMGLHTMVAEGGVNLSGGQRQRLLIARALATHPKIVFFDEATSALDNKTQAVVSAALDRRRVTRLVIAHRLSTIQNADRIYVLERGRIVQQGSFEELRQQEGLFKELVSRQMV
ncbi:MAG: ATP-binding cassette domain-containing protein, partial [Pirellulaceae bacterium]